MRGGAATFSADLPAPPLEAADPAQPSFPLGKPVTRIFFCRDDQDDLVPPCFFVRRLSQLARRRRILSC